MKSSAEAYLERAFGLAYFFHPDRDAALHIATAAMAKLRLAERTQARRCYYRPRGRRLLRGALSIPLRSKVSVGRAQLLQRLVLLESSACERAQEARCTPDAIPDDELVLRFVKHLVGTASRRNSLYVAAAMGRVLHSYSTAEAQELFSLVVQDPDRVPDDSYVRWIKQNLFREVKERFGAWLRTCRGAHGEEVFETAEPSPHRRQLVRSCLELLTPWDTPCPVPPCFDALSETLKPLRSPGLDPDSEHPIEVSRMHSLIHPACLLRLMKGLRLPEPADRLSIPRIFHSGQASGDGCPPEDRTRPPALTRQDLEQLRSLWARQDQARKHRVPTHVTLRVDGRERARLALAAGASARFDCEEGCDLLEVHGVAGQVEIPLALHLLGPTPLEPRPQEATVDLGSGWELVLSLTPELGQAGVPLRVRVEARCRVSGLASRLDHGWRSFVDPWAAQRRWVAARAVTLAGLLLLAASFFAVPWRAPEPVAPGESTAAPSAETGGETTRGPSVGESPVTLATASRLYAGFLSGPEADAVQELLGRALASTDRFQLVATPEAADAAFKGRLEIREPATPADRGRRCRLELQLVDERGRRLWSATVDGPDWKTAVQRAVADLLRESERAERTER